MDDAIHGSAGRLGPGLHHGRCLAGSGKGGDQSTFLETWSNSHPSAPSGELSFVTEDQWQFPDTGQCWGV